MSENGKLTERQMAEGYLEAIRNSLRAKAEQVKRVQSEYDALKQTERQCIETLKGDES